MNKSYNDLEMQLQLSRTKFETDRMCSAQELIKHSTLGMVILKAFVPKCADVRGKTIDQARDEVTTVERSAACSM